METKEDKQTKHLSETLTGCIYKMGREENLHFWRDFLVLTFGAGVLLHLLEVIPSQGALVLLIGNTKLPSKAFCSIHLR